jgi:hypothetical protein
MKIEVHGLEFDANPANSAIFMGKTLLNGIYTDLDDDYVFIPAELPNYPEVAFKAKLEGIPVYEIDSYDPEATPFVFMINALCRLFREEVEVIDGNQGD